MVEPADAAAGLAAYIDASPSPFHAVANAGALLQTAGFVELAESDRFPTERGRYYLRRGGSLVGWSSEHAADGATPLRVVGAHTDSPNLRVKPQPSLVRYGWRQLGVEVYGGPILNSWLDRDLGLSGRVALRTRDGLRTRLVLVDRPLLRVPSLAIHLDRSANSAPAPLNPQQHLAPIWGVGTEPADLTRFLAEQVGAEPSDVLGSDLMTHDLTPAARLGLDGELLAAPRTDNLATSYAATRALVAAAGVPPREPLVRLAALFDHEEVGSVSERGAASSLLTAIVERVVIAAGGDREDYHQAMAGTVIASADMAHAVHPNYAERYEPQHLVAVNAGPVLKVNNQLRYATDAPGAAVFALACEQAGVPMQRMVVRSDIPCGSTVGPITSALTGATTVDVGAPTLSMHSARELVGVADQQMYAGALTAFLAPAG